MIDECQVLIQVLALEARAGARKSRGRRAVFRPVSADQAAREDAVGRDADAELTACGQDGVLDAARDQRVLDLQVGDRMHRGGAADGVAPRPRKGRCSARIRLGPSRRSLRRSLRSERSGPGARAGRCRCDRSRGAPAFARASSSRPRGACRSRPTRRAGSRIAPNFTLSSTSSRLRLASASWISSSLCPLP